MKTATQTKALTDRLYTAAERAGFRSELAQMRIEIAPTTTGSFFVAWEPEMMECGLDFDYRAILDRAEKWLEKVLAA